jgi:YD repeat-containing protein
MRNVVARCLATALACALSAVEVLAQTSITFQYFYDETGQLTRAVDSTGIVIEWVYDAVGNILEIKRSGVTAGQLTIFEVLPSQGGSGTLVTIQGQGFSTAPSGNTVLFNDTPAQVVSAAAGRLSVLVPAGASTGPVSVTVGSSTAVSPSPFTVLAIPVVTSVTPRAFEGAHPPASIRVRGVNLTGSSFELLPALNPPPVVFGVPQFDPTGTVATLPITVASNARGSFVLVATNTLGSSDAFPNAGNTLAVISAQDDGDSDGDGFPDGLELLFGSDPFDATSVPSITSRGDLTSGAVSIVNTALSFTSQSLVSGAFSVVNTLLTFATPQTLLSAAFTVTNTALAGATQVVIGPAISILNSPAAPQSQQAPPQGAAPNPRTLEPRDLSISLSQPLGGERLVAGQTITLRADAIGPEAIAAVQFVVNGQTLATDQTSPYELLFTVPSGVDSLTFGAIATDSADNQAVAVPVGVTAQPDPVATITGRVVDAAGNSVQGAIVDLLSQGLEAEFFEFEEPLGTLPDLAGRAPDRITRVTALNMRNPNGVFGADPMGSDLAPDYAVRFTGWINITTAGAHRFWLGAHEGARLKVAGVTVVDMPTSTGAYQEGSGAINLAPGLVPVAVTYFEGAGSAELQLSFAPPGSERQVVPPVSLVPSAQPFVTTTDSSGTFTLRGVPAALDVIQVRATVTVNSQSISTPSARVAPLPADGVNVGDIVVAIPQP